MTAPRRFLVSLTGLLALALPLHEASEARACGGFFRARTVAPEKRPSLSREKVLLIHDRARGRQHFVREVAFRRAAEPFGFVVPTPSRPDVASIKKQPFTALREQFPFARYKGGGGIGRGSGGGPPGSAPAGVEVLEVKKVGSFTAFILSATDESALATWLADNDLASTKEADAWLAHYVKMKFFYVAMRYDPPKNEASEATPAVEAETMRISFDTPIPYYPYLEPDGSGLLTEQPRLMELWFVGTDPVVPVALRTRDGRQEWVRPLESGLAHKDARDAIEPTLKPPLRKLLPKGPLQIQTFQDQKFWRTGFEDVLFAYEEPQELDDEQRAALLPLLGILDPALVKEGT